MRLISFFHSDPIITLAAVRVTGLSLHYTMQLSLDGGYFGDCLLFQSHFNTALQSGLV